MKILIVQTAFIGDVVLATPLIEKLSRFFAGAQIDFLLRKGNEELLRAHPRLNQVWTWDKNDHKLTDLLRLIREIRKVRYDLVINLQRFWSMSLLTACSGARRKVGFRTNLLSLFLDRSIRYRLHGAHETERNLELISDITDNCPEKPRLYPVFSERVQHYIGQPFLTISPGSVWTTKQLPKEKWIEFLDNLSWAGDVLLLGSVKEYQLAEAIRRGTYRAAVRNICGELSMLESAELMRHAELNYVNDSAPLHFASAVNAPVCAVFCSTVPAFGFGPLSDVRHMVQVSDALPCRPCGVHGYHRCPKGHFRCGKDISVRNLLEIMHKTV